MAKTHTIGLWLGQDRSITVDSVHLFSLPLILHREPGQGAKQSQAMANFSDTD